MSDEVDFIVVGGGSAGCVAAATLAHSGEHQVALLEHGQPATTNPETLTAEGYKQAFINDQLMHERFSVPQPGCFGRRIFLGSGRGLGGSGAINAMVYTRGAREDFDAWGADWGWEDVAPHFEELERVLGPTRRPPTDFTEACIDAAESVGMREKRDLNDGDLSGVLGYEWMNYQGEQRRSSYVSYLKDKQLDRLNVWTESAVSRVLFDSGRRAVGVEFWQNGERKTLRARREVLLAAGALETPKLLMLSGIGRSDELHALSIPSIAHCPEVGLSLHDHPNVTVFFKSSREIDCKYPQLYGFDRMAKGGGPSDICLVFYPARSSLREGMMRMLPALALPEALHRQGTAKRLMRGAVGKLFAQGVVQRQVDQVYGIVVILGKPKSRGSVRLQDGDYRKPALLNPAYLEAPEDLATMAAGVARAREIAAAGSLGAFTSRELMPGLFGKGQKAVEKFVRQNAMTTYHYAGTARMGDDSRSVVDRQLRVRQVSGLRVIDASIMPVAPVSALNAPSMMIGLRGAKFALADA